MNTGFRFGADCSDFGRGKCAHETTDNSDETKAGLLRLRRHESCSSRGVVGQTSNTSMPILDTAGSVTFGEEQNGRCLSSILPERFVSGDAVQSEKEAKGACSTEEQNSFNAGSSRRFGESTLELKLGRRRYFDVSAGSATPPVPSSISVKKSRSTIPGGRCQVDQCKTDLKLAKDYHRRHKVCATHSKAGIVTVEGQEQRFCQQCSRLFLSPTTQTQDGDMSFKLFQEANTSLNLETLMLT